MSTIFTKIINREIPAQFVYEDDVCVVVMDKFPAVEGQTLVISRREVDYIFDLPDDEYDHLFRIAKKIAKASDKVYDTIRTCVVVEGFEVPHVHIKIYPMKDMSENLGNTITKPSEASDEELQTQADRLKTALSN